VRSRAKSITAPAPGSRRATALVVLATALALAGCGSSEDSGGSGVAADAAAVGEETAGSVAQLVQCRDWVEATEDQKLATIADIRSQVNLEGTGVDAPALSDSEALGVFDARCREPQAQGFRLYVLYARAVAFKPLQDIAGG
jgi:hypothetical protein